MIFGPHYLPVEQLRGTKDIFDGEGNSQLEGPVPKIIHDTIGDS